jgi:hypothetical protein
VAAFLIYFILDKPTKLREQARGVPVDLITIEIGNYIKGVQANDYGISLGS